MQPAGAATWIAPNPTTPNWSLASNWGGSLPFVGDLLSFDASGITTTNNDLAQLFQIGGINFNPAAQSYTLNGNTITLSGAISNFGTITQTINLPMLLSATQNIDPGIGGTLVLGGNVSGAGVAINVIDSGVVSIAGQTTFTGLTTIGGGTMTVSGQLLSRVQIATASGATGVMIVNGGKVIPSSGTNPSIQIGISANTQGALILNSGTITLPAELWLSTVDGGFGGLVQSGGVLTTGSWLALGRGGGQGIYTQTGGTLNVNGGNLTVGSFGGDITRLHAVVTFAGGVANMNGNSIFVGEQASGNVTIMGTANVTTGGNIQIAVNSSGGAAHVDQGVFNLNGGTLTTNSIRAGNGGSANSNRVAVANFNGGLLRAASSSATFILSAGAGNSTTTFNAYVWPGGLKLDDQGFNLTVGQAVSAPLAAASRPAACPSPTLCPSRSLRWLKSSAAVAPAPRP